MHTPLKKEKIQDPPVEHDLYVTLEEINSGCVKKMKISRRVLQTDGSPKKEDKYVSIGDCQPRWRRWLTFFNYFQVSISVKPGWKSGTKVTFQKEGDQSNGKIPSDIVFIIRDKPHPLFRREGSDLRYTARLTLKQVSHIVITFTRFIRISCTWHIFIYICEWLKIEAKGERNDNICKVIEWSPDGDASAHGFFCCLPIS